MAKNELEKFLIAQAPDGLLMAAENGDPEAMCYVGYMYYKGIHKRQNYAKAFQWLQRAVMYHNANAAYFLGLMYLKGEGTTIDVKQGLELLERAANQDHQGARNLFEGLKQNYIQYGLGDITLININPWNKRYHISKIQSIITVCCCFILLNLYF